MDWSVVTLVGPVTVVCPVLLFGAIAPRLIPSFSLAVMAVYPPPGLGLR